MSRPITPYLASTLSILLAAAFAAPASAQDKPKSYKPAAVTAAKTTAAPKLDGVADDAVWKTAPVYKFKAIKGSNFKDGKGETEGSLQLAYSADTIYLLITYADPTMSVQRSPFVKQADGSWKKLSDPDDKGGDNNKFYEDKMAIIWNMDNSIFGFNERFSCGALCHAGEPGKAYGNKYSGEEGEIGDIWHMKYVRTGVIGQTDDQYVDHTQYDKEKSPEAGRKSDAKTGGGYNDVKLVNGKPEFMNKDGKAANKGGSYWIKEEDKVAFDDSKFKAGDEVASIRVAPFTGDRGDIATAAKWAGGKWSIEMSRKLVTGSKTDVNFSDLAKTYGFGIAFFDNAQVRHAMIQEPLILSFAK